MLISDYPLFYTFEQIPLILDKNFYKIKDLRFAYESTIADVQNVAAARMAEA